MKVSVIVPVFRVPGGMLTDCVESLVRQTVGDIEILCVLDGPDEEARGILEVFRGGDARIQILQSGGHHGASAARNLGLAAARGDWFAFADADDWVEPTLLEELLEAAATGGCPLASCTWRHDPPLPKEGMGGGDLETFDFSCPADLARAMNCLRNGSCCGRLFARKHFGHFRFDEDLRHGEDLVFLQRVLDRAGKMSWLPRALYVYRAREGSASRKSMSLDSYQNWLCALERRMAISRRLLSGNPAARRILAWDTLCAINDPRVRRGWGKGERREGWLSTRRFLSALERDFDVLPADIRALWRWECFSPRAFYHRPQWVNAWMWHRIRKACLRLSASGTEPGE